MNAMPALAMNQSPVPHHAQHLDGLADALLTERRLLANLLRVLRTQRTGVAADDLEAVDESVFAAQRILLTLQEARRRRRALLGLMVGREDVGLGELEQVLGTDMTDMLRAARDDLQVGARELARELAVNKQVLSGAIDTGERLIRALSGAPAESNVYSASPRPPASGGGGLLNTRV